MLIKYCFTDDHGEHIYSFQDNAYRAHAINQRVGLHPSTVKTRRMPFRPDRRATQTGEKPR